ncbi:hypothetical protein [Tenacibaculum finnmarkense]|uniref:hypothetical protein n=1 Tax=Tenacibaculum finnmarkense TaxID=2781243 RepID=UPI001EFC1D25|nr:hypothetical protein [Tenacibaculum finnmarkense]MCG8207858.1 hypothetical protein [Tenacibaculum finnmarkense genomovar finnmarkense]MCG8723920.1 hypothetical protein [Tenacibaculum finnmarkense]MCG8765631.1 hypothetical protein [Tenacibaculum finnmarkense]MCG8778553.1 hypothetical protein [Tenacibaculum finnmarkense]MCM8907044.1 hypothetical protein [Tenacibaculum finnmarkense genomovar finnmarkense]
MNYKEINKAIIKEVYFIMKEHDFLSDSDKYGTTFYKKNQYIYISFGYSLREDKNPDIFENNTYSKNWLDIAFPEIEKIIHPILSRNSLFGQSITYDEVYSTFSVPVKFKNQVLEKKMKIANEQDVIDVSDLLIKFFREDALPYFEHWNNLTVLYDYIKGLSDDDLWDILGQFLPMKKAIIYRLCNDESALKLIEDYYEDQKKYYEEDSKDIDNIRYYNASKELKEILEKTLPIYNVEV